MGDGHRGRGQRFRSQLLHIHRPQIRHRYTIWSTYNKISIFLRFYVQADTENHCRRHLLGLRFNSTHNIYHAVGPTILINSSLMHVLVVMWGHYPSVHTRPFIVQVLPSYIFESRIFHLSPIADFIWGRRLSINSNLGPTLHCFEDAMAQRSKIASSYQSRPPQSH